MAYIIIHPKTEILQESILETINKHLQKRISSLEKILEDPDFCIIEEEKGNIKIEQIKMLQKKLLYTPFNKSHQFGIIKDAHLMTTEAQNALLKTLEECPEKTVLILTINNEDSVLQTILSRCTRIYPKGQTIKAEETEQFQNQKLFLQMETYEKINHVEKIIKDKEVDQFINDLILFFQEEQSKKIKNNKDYKKETEILKTLIQAKDRIKKNVNVRIALEYICFKIDHN